MKTASCSGRPLVVNLFNPHWTRLMWPGESGVLGARRDGSPPIYFVHSMHAGIKWPLKGSVVASGDSAPKGGLAGCHD